MQHKAKRASAFDQCLGAVDCKPGEVSSLDGIKYCMASRLVTFLYRKNGVFFWTIGARCRCVYEVYHKQYMLMNLTLDIEERSSKTDMSAYRNTRITTSHNQTVQEGRLSENRSRVCGCSHFCRGVLPVKIRKMYLIQSQRWNDSQNNKVFLADRILTVALMLQCCIRLYFLWWCVVEQKLLLTAYRKSYMSNRLVPKMNDLDLCIVVV